MHSIETISCKSCNKKLLHYVVIDKDVDTNHTLVVKCPFCESQSFQTKIKGKIHIGPIGKDESNYSTVVSNIESTPDVTIFHLKKGSRNVV